MEQIFGAGIVGLLVASLVGGATVLSGKHFSDIQARQAQHFSDVQARQTLQLENLRFVRDRAAAAKPDEPFPFAGLDLEGQDLRELTLPHANFENANLTRAYLIGADLSGADLVHVSLRGVWLNGDLDGADVCAADLTDARVDEASLRDAVLGGADLTRASFQETDLTGAKFGSSDKMFFCKAAPNLTETDLCSSNLAGADLKRASNLTSAKLSHIHYDEKTIWPDGFRPPEPSEALNPGEKPLLPIAPDPNHRTVSHRPTRQSGPPGTTTSSWVAGRAERPTLRPCPQSAS